MAEDVFDSARDEISLRPYLEVVWHYRRVIGVCIVAAAALFAIGTASLYVVVPTERQGTVQFRLIFSGAEQKRYPNGTPFSPSEIVATSVLAEVFASNDLNRYTTFQRFQQSLYVLEGSHALQALDDDYRAKMSDTKLTAVEREKLESEYLRKRQSIRDPEFRLTLQRKDRLVALPAALMEKVLAATLETWARQAAAQKGAANPDIDIVSRGVFERAVSNSESFLVRVDVLRTGAERLVKALATLQKVPGARAVRTAANRSVSEELASVESILKFEIEPLMGLARLRGTEEQDALVLSAYLSNQVVKHRLDLRTFNSRAQNLQTSLREYMAQRGGQVDTSARRGSELPPRGSPGPDPTQLSDHFIDRLMEMSAATQLKEMEYRRNLTDKFIAAMEAATTTEREIGYYEDLLKQLSATAAPRQTIGAEVLSVRLTHAVEALNQAADRMQALYDEISMQTLNPSRRLYTVVQPFRVQTLPSLPWRTVFVAFALTLMLTLLVAVIGVLVHDSRRSAALEPHLSEPAVVASR